MREMAIDAMTSQSDLVASVLAVAFGNQLVADNAETGIAALAAHANRPASVIAWHEAVAKAVADGLIHDPVRLLPGALQCHWRLELTPAGYAELARLRSEAAGKSSGGSAALV